jgi:hypothetical protein
MDISQGNVGEAVATTDMVTRVLGPNPKGSPLDNEEIDSNFLGLENNKLNKIIGPNKMLYTSPQGNIIEVSHGPVDYVWTSNGENAAPSWKANPGLGAGIPLIIEAEGVQLSTNASKINIKGTGVVVTEPSPDEFIIEITGSGVSESDSEYFPGYIYNYIDSSSFSVIGLNITPLFYLGRRLVFKSGGSTRYGQIVIVDYDLTSEGDTTIVVQMEASQSLFDALDVEFGLTTSAVSWSPLANSPFDVEMTALATGKIGATNFWIVAGKVGNLAYSVNEGATWVEIATGTTETIYDLAYDPSKEEFWVVGGNNFIMKTSTGTSWAAPAVLPTPFSSTEDILSVLYNSYEDIIMLNKKNASTTIRMLYTDDGGDSWTLHASNTTFQGFRQHRHYMRSNVDDIYQTFSADLNVLLNIGDSSYSPATAGINGDVNGAEIIWDGVYFKIVMGKVGGAIGQHRSGSRVGTDTALFSGALLDVAYSVEHERWVIVGENAQIAFLDDVDFSVDDAWEAVPNGFNPMSDITRVIYDDVANKFIACNTVGQICVSSNGAQ